MENDLNICLNSQNTSVNNLNSEIDKINIHTNENCSTWNNERPFVSKQINKDDMLSQQYSFINNENNKVNGMMSVLPSQVNRINPNLLQNPQISEYSTLEHGSNNLFTLIYFYLIFEMLIYSITTILASLTLERFYYNKFNKFIQDTIFIILIIILSLTVITFILCCFKKILLKLMATTLLVLSAIILIIYIICYFTIKIVDEKTYLIEITNIFCFLIFPITLIPSVILLIILTNKINKLNKTNSISNINMELINTRLKDIRNFN